ncbi:hypothetical protein [Acrocarpospora sp. B8E8]|uniref:hypothetical protein n=1 Tax=Acrocarpospora sp. B8E8 TaxID=3153572 RepID=UPI00325EAB9B
MAALFALSLVTAAHLIRGPLNTYYFFQPTLRVISLLDRDSGVDPDLCKAIEEEAAKGFERLVQIYEPGSGVGVCRFHMERDIPGGLMAKIVVSPLQWDVHVDRSLCPEPAAQLMAAHGNNTLRRFQTT